MPYKNEHAARLRDPGDFDQIVQLWAKESECLRALGGNLKSDPGGPTKEQSIRFKKDQWTVDAAKAWLKDHHYEVILFEPAADTGSEDSTGGPDRRVVPFRAASSWFEVKNQTDESVDIFIYDYIDPLFGIGAANIAKQLKAITSKLINLHLNSPGGEVFDGFAIYNLLNEHAAKIVVHVDGLAASIASVIAMAGDEILMAENASLMIHEPWCFAAGDAAHFRKEADILDKLSDSIAGVYVARTGKTLAQVKAWMAEETWLSATEAKERGFATGIKPAKSMAASYDPSVLASYRHVPAALQKLSASAETRMTPIGLLKRRQALLEKSTAR